MRRTRPQGCLSFHPRLIAAGFDVDDFAGDDEVFGNSAFVPVGFVLPINIDAGRGIEADVHRPNAVDAQAAVMERVTRQG